MEVVNDCFNKVKKDCFEFISSQETKKDKFRSKKKMIKSFLIPVSQWISKRANKKKTLIIGLAGGQGSGKTTISSILSLILKKCLSHEDSHWEETLQCSYCDKAFLRNSILISHLRPILTMFS